MKRTVRIIALIAALVLALSALCACGGKTDGGAVMTLEEHTIGEGTYRYLYATYKARYLSRYSDASDTAAFWSAEHADGEMNAEWMDLLIRDNIRMQLAAEYLFDDAGEALDEDTVQKVDEYISDVKNERFDGDDEKFSAALEALGVDGDGFRASLLAGEKMNALFERYFGSNGTRQVTDAERDEYYRANYVRFAQINVNDAYAYVEEDGHYVQNTDGSYETRALTDGEAAEKQKEIAKIDERLAAGETVEALYAEYSENTDYPNGYYFTRSDATDYDEAIVSAAFALAEGEWTKLDTAHGTFYVERLPDRKSVV